MRTRSGFYQFVPQLEWICYRIRCKGGRQRKIPQNTYNTLLFVRTHDNMS